MLKRSFDVRLVANLAVEKSARSAELLVAFNRWSAAEWKRGTLALR